MSYSEETITVSHQSPIIHQMLRHGATEGQMIQALYHHSEELLKEIYRLSAIAPRKITVGETTYIYRCPDHLIPDPQ